MKSHIGLISVLTVLAAVLFLSVLISCNDRGAQLRQALAAADSLITAAPQAALDTLMTIDSSDAARLPRADRAFHTLLRTEAEYKCWLPVAENTAISEAVDYYRRKGPEDRLARALVMQGAVLSEQGDTEGAMLAYKEAEPLLEYSGDLEQLGLLHTRIGELYQTTYSDMSLAVNHYRNALRYFEEAGAGHRLAAANLTLSRILLPDSADIWIKYHTDGSIYATLSSDTAYIIESLNQKAQYLINYGNDTTMAARISQRVLQGQYGYTMSKATFNSFCQTVVEGYLHSGNPDSARVYADMMIIEDAVDSLRLYKAMSRTAELEGDWAKVIEYERAATDITEEIERKADTLALAEREADLELRYAQLAAKYRNLWLYLIISVLTAISFLTAYLTLRYKKSLSSIKRDFRKAMEKVNKITGRNDEDDCDTDDTEMFSNAVNRMIEERHSLKEKTQQLSTEIISILDKIVSLYFEYHNPDVFRRLTGELLEHDRKSIIDNAVIFINIIYPEFIDNLRQSYNLTEKELNIVSLISCGLSNNAICMLMNLKKESLSVYKSTIKRKIGENGKLSDSLLSIIASYFS